MFSGLFASREAILATQRYLHDAKAILGTQRYLHDAKAILGTQRYLHDAKAILGTQRYLHGAKAILGTQRYLDDATRRDNIRDNIRDYPSTLSKHFTQALYQSTLSKHFIKVFLKHFRNTRQGITKVLRQGITTSLFNLLIGVRYYEV